MEMIKQIVLTFRFPTDAFYRMRHKGKIKYALSLYLLVLFVRIFQIYFMNEPLADVLPKNASLLLESCKLLIPLMSWVLVSYGISSIRDGESKLSLVFISTAYCMLPYILFTPILTMFSRILSIHDKGIYNTFLYLVWLWIIIMFIKQVIEVNNFTLRETFELIVISLFGIVILWASLFLMYILTVNVVTFISDVFSDINILLFNS